MVIGLFPSPEHAAVCLSNLAEAGFAPGDLSVIMKTPEAAAELASVSGRLNGVTVGDLPKALTQLGVSPADAKVYRDGVLQGGVCIAVAAADAEAAAAEMLRDHGAQNIRSIPTA
jgi:hypothetical protein